MSPAFDTSDIVPGFTPLSSTDFPLCVCVHADFIAFFLYNILFFHCLWAMGLEAKHLLNCCQARKWVIKLPREEINDSRVNGREWG